MNNSEFPYRRIFETTRDGILLIDAKDEKIYDANPYLLDMLGYTHSEMAGKKLWEIGVFKNIEASKDNLRELLEKGMTRFEDLPLLTKDGRVIEVEFVSSVYKVGSREVIQCNIRDITERKALERQKDDFFAMMTHDFKSPLTTVIGYAELIQAQKSLNEVVDMAKAIGKSGDKLLKMVNDFLTVARLKHGGIPFDLLPNDISEILREVSSDFSDMAKKKGIALETDIPELPKMLFDRTYFERAVSNLIQNAITYTQSGGKVTVKAETGERENRRRKNDKFIMVSVSDTGPGIPREELAYIFDKFYRSPKTAKTKGSGLGLALVKAVTEALGGRVDVESEPGKGSVFKVFFPVKEM